MYFLFFNSAFVGVYPLFAAVQKYKIPGFPNSSNTSSASYAPGISTVILSSPALYAVASVLNAAILFSSFALVFSKVSAVKLLLSDSAT